jgi:membrane protein insertase Oxa1/YidC/SpoIIIJ
LFTLEVGLQTLQQQNVADYGLVMAGATTSAVPMIILFFIFQFPVPAGLVIYWATTKLWTAGQQLVLKRRIEAEIEAKGGSLTGQPKLATAAALVGDDVAADEEPADDTPATPAATEDVVVRGAKGVPRRRGKKGSTTAVAAEAPAPDAPAPEAAPEDVATPPAETPPAAAPQKKKRTPPKKKKVSGGPSRPASRKPPKRRK